MNYLSFAGATAGDNTRGGAIETKGCAHWGGLVLNKGMFPQCGILRTYHAPPAPTKKLAAHDRRLSLEEREL